MNSEFPEQQSLASTQPQPLPDSHGQPAQPSPLPPDSQVASKKVLTVPNLITLARVLCLPVFCWLLFGVENRATAAILLGALGATDWVDGWAARRLNQHSEIGQVIDPVADRLLFFVGIVSLMIDQSAPLVICVLTLAREAVVSAATLTLAALGASRIAVTWLGKTGTFILMFAFPLYLMSNADVAGAQAWSAVAWVFGIVGVAVSYVAMLGYVPLAKAAIRSRD